MMALKCDVCGGYFDYPNTSSEVTGFAYLNNHDALVGDSIDICPECYKAIETTLNNRRKITIVCSDRSEDDLK